MFQKSQQNLQFILNLNPSALPAMYISMHLDTFHDTHQNVTTTASI